MANDNKNINELVSDDDATAELEALTCPRENGFSRPAHKESNARTSAFSGADAGKSNATSRLQYDLEQLRSRWQGLTAELLAREEMNATLAAQTDELRAALDNSNSLLRKRSQTVRSLLAEMRRSNDMQREFDGRLAAAEQRNVSLEKQLETAENALLIDGSGASEGAQLARTEEYADGLRRRLQDLLRSQESLDAQRGQLQAQLEKASRENQRLASAAASAARQQVALEGELEALRATHEEEIRYLRFDLGEAQETVAQTEELNSQLASDLVDTRGFKEELERMLCDSDEHAKSRIDRLEAQLGKAVSTSRDLEKKLDAKDEAINVLLAELARKTEQLDSIQEIGDVIQEMDDRIADNIDVQPVPRVTERDRTTRLLVGKIGDQVLRFPLFKTQLTIGRTADNDIQLNAVFISRRHAVVISEGEMTRIIDWGSKNGVYVNTRRVTEHFLKNGDIVRIGNAKFRYEERPKREG